MVIGGIKYLCIVLSKKRKNDKLEPLVIEKQSEMRIPDNERVFHCSQGWWTNWKGVFFFFF